MNWKQAFALGLCSVGEYAKKEPTAYSYNGMVFPALPEWDYVQYPYAYIYYDTYQDIKSYCLRVINRPIYWLSSTDKYYYSSGGSGYIYHLDTDDNAWDSGSYGIFGEVFANRNVVWSNFDIMKDKNGSTVAFAGTDPIPVYE